MARYYNKGNGSLAVTLRGGRSASLSGKSWTNISVEDEGAEDLVSAVKKGFLVRFEDDPKAPPTPVIVPVLVESPVLIMSAAPIHTAPVVLEAPEEVKSVVTALPASESEPSSDSDEESGDKIPQPSRRRKV